MLGSAMLNYRLLAAELAIVEERGAPLAGRSKGWADPTVHGRTARPRRFLTNSS
jgi:hypothetical protein